MRGSATESGTRNGDPEAVYPLPPLAFPVTPLSLCQLQLASLAGICMIATYGDGTARRPDIEAGDGGNADPRAARNQAEARVRDCAVDRGAIEWRRRIPRRLAL